MRIVIQNLIEVVLAIPRALKQALVICLDFALCILTVWLAFYLRLGDFITVNSPTLWVGGFLWAAIISAFVAIPVFIMFGLYRAIFRYTGSSALFSVCKASGVYALIYASMVTLVGFSGVPRTIGFIQPILLLLFVGASRASARGWLGRRYENRSRDRRRSKVLIYGAGSSGRQLYAALKDSNEMQVVGFLDDDECLHGHLLNGRHVYSPSDLLNLVNARGVDRVLLAMPGLPRHRRNDILRELRAVRIAVRTLPNVIDLAHGKVGASDLQDLDIHDLLGREPVSPNQSLLAKNVHDKVVLVTGAGGSIGGELCRQLLAIRPRKLIMIDQSEFALYSIHQELEMKLATINKCDCPQLVPILASVENEHSVREILSTWRPSTIYHSAAYKHVPLVEHNVASGIKNNVFGTLSVARGALEYKVRHFVLISTDKAVRPTNVMGAAKRLAEMTLQALSTKEGETKFSMVRFGNVLGSSGSVVPKFRQQILDGGPLTVTHPEVTRYFMTVAEAAQLVIQAGAMDEGGDVFVLDMGNPVRIMDLATRMIELSGLSVKDERSAEGDIAISLIGLRPGEKLYEELLIGDDPQPTSHDRIMRAREECISWKELEPQLASLSSAIQVNDTVLIRSIMETLVAGYIPEKNIVDWIYLEREKQGKLRR